MSLPNYRPSVPYKISNPNRCVRTCQNQPVVNPVSQNSLSVSGLPTTNINGGACIGMRADSSLSDVDLPRNYTDDNSNAIGGDVGAINYINLGGGSNGDITNSAGLATFNSDGLSLEVGDCIKFDTTAPYSGAYRVLSNNGVDCVFNATYVSGTGQISSVFKQSGTIDQQSNPYLMRGNRGNKMERDRVHQVQHAVLDNAPALLRSGYYNHLTQTFTTGFTYTDRWPNFKVSGGATGVDKSVEPHGLSVGGGYAMKLGIKGTRGVKRGRHDGKNER